MLAIKGFLAPIGTGAVDLFHAIEWGTFPSYFGGLALIFTVYLINRDKLEKRQEQATKIAAWSELQGDVPVVLVRNASDLPCWNVTVTGAAGNKPRKDARQPLRLSKFDDDVSWMFKPLRISAIGPGQTVAAAQFSERRRVVRVENVFFTDAAGARWIRRRGNLERVRRSLLMGTLRRAGYWPRRASRRMALFRVGRREVAPRNLPGNAE